MRVLGALGRKLQGLALLVVIVGLLAFTVLVYQKALPWQSTVPMTVKADRAGHQLDLGNDVKYHGVVVGKVRTLSLSGDAATIGLAIDPQYVDQIPQDVKARILPKTLFGEKFVDLVAPSPVQATGAHLHAGTVIPVDHSQTAMELQHVFDDLTPLLKTLKPAQLNLTLSAIADALRGRGEALGKSFVRADTYLADFNPSLPKLDHDISGIADLASNLDQVSPDLLASLRNLSQTAQTFVAKKDTFATFLKQATTFSGTATQVLDENAHDLVALADVSKPTLALLARYSPEYPCLLEGLDEIEPLLAQTFQAKDSRHRNALHIDVELIVPPPAYTYPKDKPSYVGYDTGPDCHGLPTTPQNVSPPSAAPASGAALHTSAQPDTGALRAAGIGLDGSANDKRSLSMIVGPMLGIDSAAVSDSAAMAAGPFMRGMAVKLK